MAEAKKKDVPSEKITFNEAGNALSHLQKRQTQNGQAERPPLITLKGWDRASKINQVKQDIKEAFSNELDRRDELVEQFQDAKKELQEIQKERQDNRDDNGNVIDEGKEKTHDEKEEELRDQIDKINEELQEMSDQERVVKFSRGKLTKNEIESVATAEIIGDLGFAIDLNSDEKENGKDD